MSLKAKIEAVVYAAEEPVTLAQLAAAFSSDVLEELAAAESEPEHALHPAAEASSGEASLWSETPPAPQTDAESEALPGAEPSALSEADSGGQPDAETAEKKAARQRERSIREGLQRILQQLMDDYSRDDRGIEIREIAGGYRMATKPEVHDAVRGFVKALKPPLKLSLQALETLAVIAYKQPVTAPEVNEIRGVDSGGVLGSLIGRKLIATAGRKQVIGRPILYRTTKEFLLRFGLKDLNELPSMEEFEKMAGELAEAREEEEEAAMRSSELSMPEASTSVEAASPGEGDGPEDEAQARPEQTTSAQDDAGAALSAGERESEDEAQP